VHQALSKTVISPDVGDGALGLTPRLPFLPAVLFFWVGLFLGKDLMVMRARYARGPVFPD